MKTLFKIFFIPLLFIVLSTNAQNNLCVFELNKTKIDFIVSKYPTFKEVTTDNDCYLVRKFHCEEYDTLNINLQNVYLTFYNDYLVDIKFDRSELMEKYFTSKCGNPDINISIDSVRVDDVKFDDELTTVKWKNDSIFIILTYINRHNQYFNVFVDSYFNIYDSSKREKIIECNGKYGN